MLIDMEIYNKHKIISVNEFGNFAEGKLLRLVNHA